MSSYGNYADVIIGGNKPQWHLQFQVGNDWGRHRSLMYARKKGWLTSYDLDSQIFKFVRREGWLPKKCIKLSNETL